MSRPVTQVRIDTHSYEITAMPATEGRRIYLKLCQIMAPGLAKLPSLKDAANVDKMLALVVGSLDAIDPATLDEICDAFGRYCVITTNPQQRLPLDQATFGEHFAGRYAAMTKWLLECIKANKFIDFLPGN